MANLSKTTIRKMTAVIDAVLAEPEFLDQNNFPEAEDCGATCCGAGWVVWNEVGAKKYAALAKIHNASGWWAEEAMRILDIEDLWNRFGVTPMHSLFGSNDSWPGKFSAMYEDAKTPKARARAFARRWEHFIKTDGLD